MEEWYGEQRAESQHEENKTHDLSTGLNVNVTLVLFPALSVKVELEQTLSAVPSTNCGFGIKGRLNVNPDYVCPKCLDQARPIDGRPITQVEVDGMLLNMEASFCYLCYMLCAGAGCALAIATRYSTAWVKFRKLLPILTSKHVSPLT